MRIASSCRERGVQPLSHHPERGDTADSPVHRPIAACAVSGGFHRSPHEYLTKHSPHMVRRRVSIRTVADSRSRDGAIPLAGVRCTAGNAALAYDLS
ncbi:hypothetical protein OG585_39750 [Streptomyces sp. NBC_01340]|uniref:hypothetical protein n=1 Tax=unclassified Streptomyces TaxID=2593676 RepID=UPI0022552391|nr:MULTISPECIES: hypothetical protein [unclassified Streptomyces]MCX4458909.1 hypothetical protein [Streptomyces sp. NBC_01719]MCX4498266.1 hypothetical protein [Streptomyces sp. NBC_01728]WSI42785.1 hypothetical protein OG585_39750 [Streptomyces sp. NBC_01340]